MRYYGITIGPIDVTLNLASKPAGLWYASYMFSNMTRMMCEYFSEDKRISVLSPFYEKGEPADGVGSYHDRILFSFDVGNEEEAEKFVQEIICRVKTETGNMLAQDIKDGAGKGYTEKIVEYMDRYLCVHYVSVSEKEMEEKSAGEVLSPFLDTLELYKSILVSGEQNYLLTLFEGMEEDSNRYIKNSTLIKNIVDAGGQNFQLFVEGEKRIKNLAYISGAGKVKKQDGEMVPDTDGWKKWKYYAVVQADGDNLGKAVKKIRDALKVSKACKKYTKRCATLIGKYGGMTIFAGGDDLLFLAPVQNRDGQTLFSLCGEISKVYAEEFTKINEMLQEEMNTTLSIGIAVHYWKFPLNEALNNAKGQLFSQAKITKNVLAARLEKSSGSVIELKYSLKSEKEKVILNFLDSTLLSKKEYEENGKKESGDESTILHSVLYHIEEYKGLFQKAMEHGKEKVDICIDNILEESKELSYFKESKKMIGKLVEDSEKSDNVYKDVVSVLSLAHFYAEREE